MQEGSESGFAALAARFEGLGRAVVARRHGHGRIHETWLVRFEDGRRCVFQRLNAQVFRDLEAVMANIVRVTAHLERALARPGAPALRPLRLVPLRDGTSWL